MSEKETGRRKESETGQGSLTGERQVGGRGEREGLLMPRWQQGCVEERGEFRWGTLCSWQCRGHCKKSEGKETHRGKGREKLLSCLASLHSLHPSDCASASILFKKKELHEKTDTVPPSVNMKLSRLSTRTGFGGKEINWRFPMTTKCTHMTVVKSTTTSPHSELLVGVLCHLCTEPYHSHWV